MLLPVHVVAAAFGLLFGYVALFSAKGATLHRKSGMLFVYAMLTMLVCAFVLAVGRPWAAVNVPAALMTAYLVITALTTVRPLASGGRWLHIGGLVLAATVGAIQLTRGFEAVANGGRLNGIPAFPFFLFGVIGIVAGAGDLQMLRTGALRGTRRIARHLWRMSLALLIAAWARRRWSEERRRQRTHGQRCQTSVRPGEITSSVFAPRFRPST